MHTFRHLCSLAFVALLATLFCQAGNNPGPDSWPGYRGLKADGHGNSSMFRGKSKPGLKLAWSTPIGSGYSGVVVADGMVVTTYAQGEKDMAGAFNVDTGQKLWSYEIGPTYKGHDGSHDGPIGTPALAKGRVFGLGAWGKFFALDAKTGKELWTLHLANDLKQEKPYYGFGTHPLVYKDLVILMAGGKDQMMMAFEPATGKKVWATGTGKVSYQSPIIWQQNNKTMLVAASDKLLMAVDPDNGQMLWSYEHEGRGAKGQASMIPVPTEKNRLFLMHDSNVSKLVEVTTSGDKATVVSPWDSRTLRNSYTPPIYHDGHVYGYNTRTLTCMNADNGELVWRSRAPGDGFLTLVDGHLVIATKAGVLSIVKAQPSGYEEVASLKVFDKTVWPLPSLVGNSIYMRGFESIVRVDVRDSATSLVESKKATGHLMTNLVKEVSAASDKQAVVDRFLMEQTSFPVIEGKDIVHFLYQGNAKDVALGGDMFGARQEKSMTRIPGTDLFYYSLALESDAMLAYVFLTDFGGPQLDARNPRKTKSYVVGEEMEFNFGKDPVPFSWFAMPDYQEPGYLTSAESKPVGKLETHELETKLLEKKYSAKVYLPAGYDKEKSYSVAYVLDANAYDLGQWQQALDYHTAKQLKQIVTVFPMLPQNNPKSAQVFLEELIPFVEKTYAVQSDRAARFLIGIGPSGTVALDMALDHSETFATVAAQSAFFFTEVERTYEERLDALAGKPPLHFYLDWGTYDIRNPEEAWDIGAFNASFAKMLKEKGFSVASKQFNQGCDWTSWRTRTGHLLQTLFSKN